MWLLEKVKSGWVGTRGLEVVRTEMEKDDEDKEERTGEVAEGAAED